MLKADIIEESDSMWGAPVVLVKKKNDEYRFTVDFRCLNALSRHINFPLPDLQDALDNVGTSQSKFFSVMDLKSSFHQIKLTDEVHTKLLLSLMVPPTISKECHLGFNQGPKRFK